MPRNPSGTVTLPTNDSHPAAPRNVIRSSDFNELMTDITSELTDSWSRSGKGAALADLDMDGFNLLNARVVYRVETFAAAPSASIPADVQQAWIEDRNARFKRVASEPPHGLKFQNDGNWWEIDEPIVTVKMAGAKGDEIADDFQAIQDAIDYAMWYGTDVLFTQGIYLHSQMFKCVPSKPTPDFADIEAEPFPGPINYPFARSDSISIRGLGNPTIRATTAMEAQFKFFTEYEFVDAMEPQHCEISNIDIDGNDLAENGIFQFWSSRFVHTAVRMHRHEVNVRLLNSAVNSFQYCIYDSTDACVLFDVAGDSIFVGCDFYIRKSGIRMITGSNSKIFGGLFTGHVYPGGGHTHRGLEILTAGQAVGHQSRNVTIDGVEAVGIDWLVYADDNDGDGLTEIWGLNITNCHTIRNAFKPDIGLAYIKNARGPAIIGNTCGAVVDSAETTLPDIQLVNVFGARVIGNNFSKSKDRAVSIEDCEQATVIGNMFTDCGRTSAPVYLRGSYSQVVNNTFVSTSGVTLFATAIEEATGGYTFNNFDENTFDADQTNPIVRFGGFTRMRDEVGTAVPTTGTWNQGDRVWFYAPAASGMMGWVCVASGTPGTWKTFGAISA